MEVYGVQEMVHLLPRERDLFVSVYKRGRFWRLRLFLYYQPLFSLKFHACIFYLSPQLSWLVEVRQVILTSKFLRFLTVITILNLSFNLAFIITLSLYFIGVIFIDFYRRAFLLLTYFDKFLQLLKCSGVFS